MNKDLERKLIAIKRECYSKSKELEAKFEKATTKEERESIREKHIAVVNKYHETYDELEAYRNLVNKEAITKEEKIALADMEKALCDKYSVVKSEEPKKEEPKKEEPKKEEKPEEEAEEVKGTHKGTEKQKRTAKQKAKRVIAFLLAALSVLGIGHHAGKAIKQSIAEKEIVETSDQELEEAQMNRLVANVAGEEDRDKIAEQIKAFLESQKASAKTTEEVPFATFGEFTDTKDEDQVMKRAQWYYDTYIADEDKLLAGTLNFSAEDIAKNIQFMNGEFNRDEKGNIDYNESQVIDVATDLHTIANYDSFAQYGNDIFFTPMAPLFTDGSLAQKGAIELDERMAEVVDAIRADDKERFMKAAEDWGLAVTQIFNYVDYNGQHVNIYQVDDPQAFFLYHMMSSKYASTILEYSEKNHIAICVPYCVDYCTGETKSEALSQIMYNLNERALDAVAIRSGNLEEYELNNPSLPQDLCISAKTYFASKYDIEKGYPLSRK